MEAIVNCKLVFPDEVLEGVLLMDGGKIVEENEPHALFDDPQDPRLKDFLSKVL